MDWNDWIGKRIFVKLNGGAVYSGKVRSTDETFIHITDKYGMSVSFAISDILKIKEEGNDLEVS